MAEPFKFQVDLTDATEFVGIDVQPTGIYAVKCTSLADHTKEEGEEAVSAKLDGSIVEGPCKGMGCAVFLGKDTSKKGNKGKWLGLGLSLGHPREKLKKTAFTDKTVVGKIVYIKVTTPPALYQAFIDGEEIDLNAIKKNFVTKDVYAAYKASEGGKDGKVSNGAAKPGTNGKGNGKAKPDAEPDEGTAEGAEAAGGDEGEPELTLE